MPPAHQCIVVKISGEAMGGGELGIAPTAVAQMAAEIQQVVALGVGVGVVIGGGNLFRGHLLQAAGFDRVVGDHMGTLATVMNGLAMGDVLNRRGVRARVTSAVGIDGIASRYDYRQAREWLAERQVVIMTGGIGNPFFTTDTAACLRAIEVGASLVLKATKVDGVYSADPKRDPTATRFERLTYNEVIARDLAVMDLPAICLCRDHRLPIRVFDMDAKGTLARIVGGEACGTLISA